MQTSGNTGAFIKKDVYSQPSGRNPRLKGKGKSPLSESMKAEMAKRKAKPAAKPAPKPKAGLVDRAKAAVGKAVADVKAIVPKKNAEVTRLKREQVDRHVEGRARKRK